MNRRLLLCAISLMAGCVSAPEVQMVPEPVRKLDVSSDGEASGDEPRGEVERWWLQLDDDVLLNLIATGLEGSPSPRIALARLAQAESSLTVARAGLWPSLLGRGAREGINFSASDSDTRSDIGILELGWDAGLWGKRSLEVENAQQFREQKWFELHAVQLALSASIAETYYLIVELRMQKALLAAQIQLSEDLERLIEARFRLGQAPANELYQQREQTALLVQLKLENDTRDQVLEKSLDVLLGQPPDTVARVMRTEVPDAPGLTGFGSLQQLIQHRADIRAGYARLRQAAAEVGIRFAERLPTLQVTAELASLAGKSLSSEWLGYGLDLALPIFAGGRLRGLEKRAQFVLEEERQRYFELWLNALEEVSSLNWQYQQQQKVITTLLSRRGYARQALDAARGRYVLGDQNYLDVLTALRGLQEADRSLVSERRRLITLWIRTREAIGR